MKKKMLTVYAVEHSMGLSLFQARTEKEALERARDRFGSYGGPYTLPKNQALEIAHAKSMGAGVL